MTAQDKFFEHDGKRITYREAEVLLCCAKGMTSLQTADRLGVCVGTINRHHENIRTRFSLKGYHTLTCFATTLQPELEKMCNVIHQNV